ncbi:uncharacterized protein WM294_013585 [Sarcoramphus papa]
MVEAELETKSCLLRHPAPSSRLQHKQPPPQPILHSRGVGRTPFIASGGGPALLPLPYKCPRAARLCARALAARSPRLCKGLLGCCSKCLGTSNRKPKREGTGRISPRCYGEWRPARAVVLELTQPSCTPGDSSDKGGQKHSRSGMKCHSHRKI